MTQIVQILNKLSTDSVETSRDLRMVLPQGAEEVQLRLRPDDRSFVSFCQSEGLILEDLVVLDQ